MENQFDLGEELLKLNNEIKVVKLPVKAEAKEKRPSQGQSIIFQDLVPWADPMDGAELLNEFSMLFKRHTILPIFAPEVISLWVLHTYAIDASQTAPILLLRSAEKRCGKTTLLSILRRICYRPLVASNISPAAVFRAIEKWKPTLLIDEADTFMKDNEELRGILNAGHTKDTSYVIRTVGKDFEVKVFNTWGAKAIALIGALPPTLMDRSIVIGMYRKKVNEKVERLNADSFEALKSKALRWTADNMEALKKAEPVIPPGLNDRVVDNWTPLLAIAEVCGWGDVARRAMLSLSDNREEEDSYAIMLLTDLKTYFEENETDKVPTTSLISYLTGLEERPWPEFKKGKAITPRQISRLLYPFNIQPKVIRMGIETQRGYYREAFADAFSRYLPILSVTTKQVNDFKDLGGNLSVTPKDTVTDKKLSKPLSIAECDTVTDKKGVEGDNGKCDPCIRGISCMLLEEQRPFCGGPFKGESDINLLEGEL